MHCERGFLCQKFTPSYMLMCTGTSYTLNWYKFTRIPTMVDCSRPHANKRDIHQGHMLFASGFLQNTDHLLHTRLPSITEKNYQP